jgi:hypothetical protein
MKPNCFFSRLDQSNFKNGYYKILMGLAEDTVRLVSSCLRQFEKITNSPGGSFNGQLGWYAIPWYCQGKSKPSEEDNCQKTWLTLFESQLPNLCEVQ